MKPDEFRELEEVHNYYVIRMQELANNILSYLAYYPDNKWNKELYSFIASFKENLKYHACHLLKNIPEEEDLKDLTCWDDGKTTREILKDYLSEEISYNRAVELIIEFDKKCEEQDKKC